ncbi:hypothetical protein JMJ35_007347 [Cladonia borealis]|uniref:C2H2-type domain-containing protein n=1 Tax=Cladonia borealis TaxID=184061 RepID=A0AA39UZI3_9LECA|nr:hypothetical protein JMJ35_007347 [Cladonia borealis]
MLAAPWRPPKYLVRRFYPQCTTEKDMDALSLYMGVTASSLRAGVIPAEQHDHHINEAVLGSCDSSHESAHSFDGFRTSTDQDPTQRIPHTPELKIHDCDPFFGLPLEDVFTEYDPDLRSNLRLEASRPNHEDYLVNQPEPTEESDQSWVLRYSDEWLSPDPGSTVDVDSAQNYGFDYGNHPSSLLSNPPLLVEGTSATTPGSSTEASNGSTNSTTVGSSLSSPSPFTSGSSSSTNLFSGLTPILTGLPGATPSLVAAPQALQPKLGLQCQACQKVVSCSARLRSHQCNARRFLCGFECCKRGTKGFTSQKDLDRHQRTVHADKALAPLRLQICQACPYETRRVDHFRRHQRTHEKEEKKKRGKG